MGFAYQQRWTLHSLSGWPVPVFDHIKMNCLLFACYCVFCLSLNRISRISIYTHAFCPVTWIPLRRSCLHLITSFMTCLYTVIRPSLSLLFLRLTNPISLSLSLYLSSSTSLIMLVALFWTSYGLVFLTEGNSELDLLLQIWSQLHCAEEKNHFSWDMV